MDPECPACSSTSNDEIAVETYECRDCGQVFESIEE